MKKILLFVIMAILFALKSNAKFPGIVKVPFQNEAAKGPKGVLSDPSKCNLPPEVIFAGGMHNFTEVYGFTIDDGMTWQRFADWLYSNSENDTLVKGSNLMEVIGCTDENEIWNSHVVNGKLEYDRLNKEADWKDEWYRLKRRKGKWYLSAKAGCENWNVWIPLKKKPNVTTWQTQTADAGGGNTINIYNTIENNPHIEVSPDVSNNPSITSETGGNTFEMDDASDGGGYVQSFPQSMPQPIWTPCQQPILPGGCIPQQNGICINAGVQYRNYDGVWQRSPYYGNGYPQQQVVPQYNNTTPIPQKQYSYSFPNIPNRPGPGGDPTPTGPGGDIPPGR